MHTWINERTRSNDISENKRKSHKSTDKMPRNMHSLKENLKTKCTDQARYMKLHKLTIENENAFEFMNECMHRNMKAKMHSHTKVLTTPR